MRPGQNKRMRGRNPGRKGPNPLTRSYESNGPDVKIRGTAQHVAEKYLQLARDAQSSGDPVMAESYLQHAEHYFRIIAAAHQAQPAAIAKRLRFGHCARPRGKAVRKSLQALRARFRRQTAGQCRRRHEARQFPMASGSPLRRGPQQGT